MDSRLCGNDGLKSGVYIRGQKAEGEVLRLFLCESVSTDFDVRSDGIHSVARSAVFEGCVGSIQILQTGPPRHRINSVATHIEVC